MRILNLAKSLCSSGIVFAILALSLSGAARAQTAVDGTLDGVIAPTYLASSGAQSFVRLFNGGSKTSTFTVSIMGSPNDTNYGTATYQVPAYAAVQKALSSILADAGAPATPTSPDTGFSLYVQDTDLATGYQHVVYSSVTTLFENESNCKAQLNDALGAVTKVAAVMSVHTSTLAQNAYPSAVLVHNYLSTPITYNVTVIDEATGATMCPPATTTQCAVTVQAAANETKYLDFHSVFETALNWTPTASQVHAILLITDATNNAAPQALVGQVIRNTTLGGDINMSAACALNRPSSQLSSAAATTFQGTIAGDDGVTTGTFSFTVHPTAASTASAALARSSSIEIAASQDVEKTQSLPSVTGTLSIIGGSTTSLAGTYNPATQEINMPGPVFNLYGVIGGFSFACLSPTNTGATPCGFVGTYTGPGNTTGSVSALNSSKGTVSAYCGSWSKTSSSGVTVHGSFNFQVTPDGSLSGNSSGASNPVLSGHVSGSSFSGSGSGGAPFSGTIQGTTISGRFTPNHGSNGTITGNQCNVPSAT